MRAAYDTSVLVAALVEDHPDHERAVRSLRDRKVRERIASAHALAETWAVLTAMPLDPPISGQVALTVLERLRATIRFVAPTLAHYTTAASRCASLGLRSGAIYDALHLASAEAQDADLLLTFNDADFTRLTSGSTPRIVVPA